MKKKFYGQLGFEIVQRTVAVCLPPDYIRAIRGGGSFKSL